MIEGIDRQLSPGGSQVPAQISAIEAGSRSRGGARHNQREAVSPSGPVTVRLEDTPPSWLVIAQRDVQPLIHPLTTAFVVVIFVVFILLARDSLRDRAVRLFGSGRIHITTVAMTDAGERVSRYLLMQLAVNTAYGATIGLALWGLGIPHPLLWAVITSVLRFIPYFGILAAGMGPLLMALAISPHWRIAAWTLALYVTSEVVTANAVEPWLYGTSTGVSSLAILVAAIFWTWIWGVAGLLLSTPLTVCLIVLGRHVPRLEFMGILFGEEAALDPSQRLYQRILASDIKDAAKLINEELRSKTDEEVHDGVLIPVLSLIEEARHSGELEAGRADRALNDIEELLEERWASYLVDENTDAPRAIFVAVRDQADEITSRLLMHLVSSRYHPKLLSADLLSSDVVETINSWKPQVICVVGIPPHAVRHVRLRCHQLRSRFPDTTVVACVPSVQSDLSNVRSRIPLEDAQQVVCSVKQARECLEALTSPSDTVRTRSEEGTIILQSDHCEQPAISLELSSENILEQIVMTLEKTFEAPIAMIQIHDAERAYLNTQCGISEETETDSALRCSIIFEESALQGHMLVVPDLAVYGRFATDSIFSRRGIRFFAGTPVFAHEGKEIGTLCVLDTRPRQITERQQECLRSLADSAMNAIELRAGSER